MTPINVSSFRVDAVETNRAGGLTDEQKTSLTRLAHATRGTKLGMAAILVGGGVAMFRAGGPAPQAWWSPWVGLGSAVIGSLIALHALGIGNRLIQDIRDGRVEAIEGAIRKRRGSRQSSASSIRTHFFIINGRRFSVGPAGFAAAPDAGFVRLFYLPKSQRAVNLEVLPAGKQAQEFIDDPMAALKTAAAGIVSGDLTKVAEVGAGAAGARALWEADQRSAASSPPIARDPRALAAAIVGRWQMGALLSVEFRPDGTVVARRPVGESGGRWSIDAAGRLHSDITGQEQAGDAWIVDDVLTLSVDGTRFSLRRVR